MQWSHFCCEELIDSEARITSILQQLPVAPTHLQFFNVCTRAARTHYYILSSSSYVIVLKWQNKEHLQEQLLPFCYQGSEWSFHKGTVLFTSTPLQSSDLVYGTDAAQYATRLRTILNSLSSSLFYLFHLNLTLLDLSVVYLICLDSLQNKATHCTSVNVAIINLNLTMRG